jgi:hypothetical protein
MTDLNKNLSSSTKFLPNSPISNLIKIGLAIPNLIHGRRSRYTLHRLRGSKHSLSPPQALALRMRDREAKHAAAERILTGEHLLCCANAKSQ